MFVSSYSTYINTNTNNNKRAQDRVESSSSKLFEQSLNKSELNNSRSTQSTPINYISHNKILSTKERIYNQLEQKSYQSNINKFTSVSSQLNAPSAYASNSKMFSLVIKHPTTPKLTDNSSLKDLKEPMVRSEMINAYVTNDKYYQLTA